jgi:type IX secretion system PorP/SprF family membrane protein
VKRLIIISYLLYLSLSSFAQDPQLTQFYSAPLYLAPSFAGATQQHRLAATYRNQWPGVPGAYVTYLFSYDHYFENFNSGVGILIMRDEAGSGDLSTTNVGVQYSYDIQVSDLWHIRPGIHFLYTQRGINFAKLLWGDQISPSGITPTIEVPSLQRKGAIDASLSVLVYSDRMWAGTSVDHLFRPNYSLYDDDITRLAMKISVFGGYQVVRRGRLLKPIDETLSLAGLFKYQDHIKQLDIGLYWYKNPLVFGLWYRGLPIISNENRGDAVCFLVGYKVEQFSIGYSYDFTINKLLTSTWGSHEISLIYEFTTHRKKTKRHMIPCPEF